MPRQLLALALLIFVGTPFSLAQEATSPSDPPPAPIIRKQGDTTPSTHSHPGARNGVVPPRVVHTVEPEFSKEARRKKISGNVLVAADVGADGSVSNVRVERGVGHGLDEQAVKCVQQYTFLPATKDGVPVASVIRIEVNFQIY